ncbi:MAG: RimK family alpha-L-glutamate ligase [Gammaproteobacteria bacterium]|nr:RimK family alpha-L-glutamate ligase [Gammaproteobacteria bacterium]
MAKASFKVAIVTDDPGWHGRQIADHLDARNCQSSFVRLQDCYISAGAEARIHIPGFAQLPDGIFVRGVPGGNLEQVVYYLDVLHACEAMSIPVVNNTRCVERSVDKGMTSFLLSLAGIATPETVFSSDFHYVRSALRVGFAEGKEYVVKPLFGSQGKGVQRLRSAADLAEYHPSQGVLYAQEFIDNGRGHGIDYRVFVVADNVVATMQRSSDGWLCNVAHGAEVSAVQLDLNTQAMAIAAAKALDMDYAGVDLICDQTGKFWVTEVNSVPAWHGLQSTTETPVAAAICDDFVSRLNTTK